VNAKNTVSDYHEVEHEQEGSVFSTLLYAEWLGKKINFLDTPGADDFAGGVFSSLHVTDTAVLIMNAQNGVEVGTEISWRRTKRFEKPVIFVCNHLDHDKTNFEKTIEEAKQLFGNKVVLTQYPVNPGLEFDAIIDIIKMKMYKWKDDSGKAEILDIPESELSKAEGLRNELIEAAAENDDELMEIFFENDTLTEEEMQKGMLTGLKNRELFPIFCTSARKNIGVERLMEFIVNIAPSPDEMPPAVTNEGEEVKCNSENPTSAFVFKNSIEPHLGEILFFKMMSGTIEESNDLINVNKSTKERLSQLFVVAGKKREKVAKLCAGDIGATVKLKETKTNHSLTEKGKDWEFNSIEFPNPKFRTAIKALNESDDEKLGEALHRMQEEDPTYILEYSKELKQLIIHGRGEHHLNTLKWHLDNIYKIETEFIAPKIPYRETITKMAQSTYRHKKTIGGCRAIW
jgi:elongation factor G